MIELIWARTVEILKGLQLESSERCFNLFYDLAWGRLEVVRYNDRERIFDATTYLTSQPLKRTNDDHNKASRSPGGEGWGAWGSWGAAAKPRGGGWGACGGWGAAAKGGRPGS